MTSLRILLVDDDEVTGRILGRLLESEGHVVDVRPSGRQALTCLRERSYDLLATDLIMQEMDGLQLITLARALHPALRCLVMSGHPRTSECPSDVVWVRKPIDIDRFLDVLAP